MTSYTEWEDFFPYILNEVPGCPVDVVEEFIKKFAIRLCEKALIIRKKASDIYIATDEETYSLNFTENLYRPLGIVYAKYDGGTMMYPMNEQLQDDQDQTWRVATTSTRPTYYWLTIDNKLHVHPKPTADIDSDPIVVECWVAPVRSATKIDDFVFDNYAETIAYGALSELQLMQQQSWNDIKLAEMNSRKWRQGLRNARAESLRGKDGTQRTEVYPKSFEVFGQ